MLRRFIPCIALLTLCMMPSNSLVEARRRKDGGGGGGGGGGLCAGGGAGARSRARWRRGGGGRDRGPIGRAPGRSVAPRAGLHTRCIVGHVVHRARSRGVGLDCRSRLSIWALNLGSQSRLSIRIMDCQASSSSGWRDAGRWQGPRRCDCRFLIHLCAAQKPFRSVYRPHP